MPRPSAEDAAFDAFFTQYGKDRTPEQPQRVTDAPQDSRKPTGMLQSIRSGIGSIFGATRASRRRGGAAQNVEVLETRMVPSANPIAGIDMLNWQNTSDAPADAMGNLNLHPNGFMFDIALSPDGSTMATAGTNGTLQLVNVQSGQIEKTLAGHTSLVMEVDFNQDGSKLVSVSYDKTARVWNAQTGELLQTISLPQLGVRVDWSSQGDIIAIGVHEKPTQLHNINTGAVTSIPFPFHTEAVIFDLTEDGQHILHANGYNVTMHDTTTGAVLKTFNGVNEAIYSVDVDPSGKYVAAGTVKGTLLIWDVQSGALQSNQSIHAGGNVKSVQFVKGGSPHLISADHAGSIIVQNIEGLAQGTPPVEVRRYTAVSPDSIISSNDGQMFFVRTGSNTDTTRLTAFDLPDPPAPPAPQPQPSVPQGVEAAVMEQAPLSEDLLHTYVQTAMSNLRTSLETDSASLPELLRRQTEREREILAIDAAIVPVRASFNSAEQYARTIEAELATLNAQYTAAILSKNKRAESDARRAIDKKLPKLANAYANLEKERSALQVLLDQRSAVTTAMTEAAALINAIYDRLSTQSQEYAAWASVNGDSDAAGRAAANTFISNGLQTGYNTMPHVGMSVNILDKQMGSSDIPAHFLAQNITEIQEHASPVLTKSGGLLKIYGRVTNTGNRAGEITVHIGGTSDRYPNLPDQYTITVYLNPGEYRDFVSTVLIPVGTESTGSVRLTATTPDEDAVMQEVRNREPRSMDSGYYVQGEGAVLHNARVIAMSGGTGTPEERLQKYLAANPTEAATIARKIETGAIAQDDFTKKFLVAEEMSRSAMEVQKILLAVENNTLLNQSISPSGAILPLQDVQGRTTSEPISFLPSGFTTRIFTLTEDTMVNFWVNTNEVGEATVDGFPMGLKPNLALSIKGTTADGYPVNYSSNRSAVSGESISLKLSAGTYAVTVQDMATYSTLSTVERERLQLAPGMQLHMNVAAYDSREILGRISIDASEKTMPVSLRVAAFDDAGKRIEDSSSLPTLNPDLPVWVVIHGRGDSEQGNNINYLAQSLASQGHQVFTLDWHDAASDNDVRILNGANWIQAAGAWAANQLKSAGLSGDKILLPSHSWGTLVAYEIAAQYKNGPGGNGFGVQAIVALDSAVDPIPDPVLNRYPQQNVVFNDVSRVSWAFRSSAFGSADRSGKASFDFSVVPPTEGFEQMLIEQGLLSAEAKFVIDHAQAYFGEHGYAVSYFANLIQGMGDSSLDILKLDDLINGISTKMLVDPYGPEATLPISLRKFSGPNGEYVQAVPTSLLPTH